MSIINNLLGSDSAELLIKGLSSQTGQSKSNISELLSMGIPVILKALQRNAGSTEGASGIQAALSKKHDGSILNSLESVFSGSAADGIEKDGENILGHIFGNRQKNIQNALSNQSGLDAATVCRLLKMAAPVVMGLLGKQQRQQKNDALDRHGLSNILGSLVGDDFQNKKQSFFESILDADNDGSIIDDLVDTVAGKKKTGIVNVFGKMFNKK
ncbi:MAG: hypothetical protein CMC56_00510 [Flavobacteriaceae bacterium]|nr:hypothetical protein [Flavobacteriaceae bacterium]